MPSGRLVRFALPSAVIPARVPRLLAAASAMLLLGAAPPRLAPRPDVAPHNLHVAQARMMLEGTLVMARVRLFRDDLSKALKRPLADDAASKAVIAEYVVTHMTLRADGVTMKGEVLDSGGDMDGDQPVWFVLVQWKAAKPVKALGVTVNLLYEAFNDQQNIVQLAKQPGDERRGLYFQAGDRSEQVVKF